jgi:oxygen-dependent protoporphyrinogen oxidase
VLPREATDLFIQPLTSDFYLTPPSELSVVNLFLLLRTMLGARFVNSPRGIRFLPEGLARNLNVELTATVTNIEYHRTGVRLTWERPGEGEHVEHADGAIVAVPAPHVPALLPQLTDDQVDVLKGITYARSLVVSLMLDRVPAESAMWLTVPDQTHPDVNVVILDHNKAPGRVPAGQGLITVYWHRDWASRFWDTDDEEVLRQAVLSIRQVLPDVDRHVKNGFVWRWDPCTVARSVGQFGTLARFVGGMDKSARVQLAGDYFSITTVDSSLASGEQAAGRLIRALRGSSLPQEGGDGR